MFNDLTFIRQWFEFVTRSLRHTNYRTDAVTGKLDGSGNLIVDATQGLPPNYVWVRLGDNRTAVPMLSKVRAVAGVDVVVAYDRLWREDVVLEVNLTRTQLDYAAAYNVPMLPANMSTPVSARDIVPGGVFADASGGLYVRVGAYWHEANYWPDSAPLALTPTATSSKKSLAVVGVDRATNTLTYTLTADRTLATNLIINAAPTTFASADIQAVIDADPTVDWRGAVELAHGDTEVDPTKIIALLWQKPTMTGADGATAGERGLVPVPAATDNVKALFGNGTWQAAIKADGTVAMTGDLNLNGNDVNNAATVLLNEGSAPSTPAANKVVVYAKSDGKVYSKDDAGTEYDLTGGGGSSYYQTVQYNGSDQTQRAKVDYIPGSNITIGVVDDGVGNRTRITFNASSTIGTTTPAARVSKWSLFR